MKINYITKIKVHSLLEEISDVFVHIAETFFIT